MGTFSAWHWILVAIVVLLLFGRGKISEFMGDAAKGIKAFKKGLSEEDKPETPVAAPTTINHQPPPPAAPVAPTPAAPPPAASQPSADAGHTSAPKVG